MKTLCVIITSFVFSLINHTLAQHETKDGFPFEILALPDGGSFLIIEKSSKDENGTTRVIDKRVNSKTAGSMYLGYPGKKDSKLIPKDEALKFIENTEAELLKYWGKDEFERLKKASNKPIPDDKAMLSTFPSWQHYETSVCLFEFAKYRKLHNAEQVGADQPATAPQLKSEGNQKPQPESEVRPR